MKNKYQTLLDYVLGRWRCPNCGTLWYSPMILNSCILVTTSNGMVVEEHVECPSCGFMEVLK